MLRTRQALMAAAVVFAAMGCSNSSERDRTAPAPAPVIGPAGMLQVDDGGTGGIPVVFAHSFAGSSRHWVAQLAHLRPTRRAIAFDLRGHGGSAAPTDTSDYAVDSLATDIGAVLDGLGLQRVVLVGHSMGGSAAVAYAGAHPDRVAGLVLVGTPGETPPAQAAQVMGSLRADYDKVMEAYWTKLLAGAQPAVAAEIRSEMKSVPRDQSLAIIGALFAFDPLPMLVAYQGPKLLVETPSDDSPGALHNLAPDTPRELVTGTSHWLQMDKPDDFNRILDEFLATIK